MGNLIVFFVTSLLISFTANRSFKLKTGASLTFFDDLAIFGFFMLICAFVDLIGDNLFPFFTVSTIVLSAIFTMLFVHMFLVPKKVNIFIVKQELLEAQQKREENRQSFLLKDAIKTALAERDAEKAGATEKGNAESSGTKS